MLKNKNYGQRLRVLYYAIYVQVYKSNYVQSATCKHTCLRRLFYQGVFVNGIEIIIIQIIMLYIILEYIDRILKFSEYVNIVDVINVFCILLIMLALCLMLSMIHYAQNYAGIIAGSPASWYNSFTIVKGTNDDDVYGYI